ncbi:hypothetical protein ACFQ07_24500, partial [Actinomadura adrarensis]
CALDGDSAASWLVCGDCACALPDEDGGFPAGDLPPAAPLDLLGDGPDDFGVPDAFGDDVFPLLFVGFGVAPAVPDELSLDGLDAVSGTTVLTSACRCALSASHTANRRGTPRPESEMRSVKGTARVDADSISPSPHRSPRPVSASGTHLSGCLLHDSGPALDSLNVTLRAVPPIARTPKV